MPSSTSLMPSFWPASTVEMRLRCMPDAAAGGDEHLAVLREMPNSRQTSVIASTPGTRGGDHAAHHLRSIPQRRVGRQRSIRREPRLFAPADEREAFVTVGSDGIACLFVRHDAADIRHEDARLAGNISTDIPRVRPRIERPIRYLVVVADQAAEDAWVRHNNEVADRTLYPRASMYRRQSAIQSTCCSQARIIWLLT